MELRELKSFSTAAKLRSISLAAERLGVGQPTVTTHIKKLEEELGVVLFDRVRRPIRLTASGAALAELAEPLLNGIAGLAARTSTAEELVPVRVAATYDIIPHTLSAGRQKIHVGIRACPYPNSLGRKRRSAGYGEGIRSRHWHNARP